MNMAGGVRVIGILLVIMVVWAAATHEETSRKDQATCQNVHYHVQTLQQACCQTNPIPGNADGIKILSAKMAAIEKELKNLQTSQYTLCSNQTDQSQSRVTEDFRSQLADLQGKLQLLQEKQTQYELRLNSTEKISSQLKEEYSFAKVPKDCQEIKTGNKSCGGSNIIDIYGAGCSPPFMVKCNMSHNPAWIIIEHNYPVKTEVKNAADGATGGNTYNIEYKHVTQAQLVALTKTKRCTQHLRYDCHHSVISHNNEMRAYWVDRDGNKMNYWPGGRGYGCACRLSATCVGGPAQSCQCEKNDVVWRHDEGTITDVTKLPVTRLYFSDTNDNIEKGHFTLGPLICY